MIEKTVKYYQIDELPQDVIDAAYESWREYWGRNADAYVGPTVDEDLKSLQFALESIQCKLVDWSVNYSGWGRNTCQVEMDSNLSQTMEFPRYHQQTSQKHSQTACGLRKVLRKDGTLSAVLKYVL